MSKLALCLAAASTLAFGGAAFAQSTTTPPAATAAMPAAPATPATPAAPPAARDPAMAAQAGAPVNPASPGAPATPAAPAPAASLATGMTLKDNTGVAIGQITDLKPDASGTQMATVKMGEDSFTVAAASLAVQNGTAIINLTQAQLQAMVHKPQG